MQKVTPSLSDNPGGKKIKAFEHFRKCSTVRIDGFYYGQVVIVSFFFLFVKQKFDLSDICTYQIGEGS